MQKARPAAYFITFRTYGTWLHGDQRRSVDRRHNAPGAPDIAPQPGLETHRRSLMKSEPVTLGHDARGLVERAFREVADHRGWRVHALNVRTNHVHVVVSAPAAPEKVMGDLKKWATRRLREAGLSAPDAPVWAEHGSTRYLWDEPGFAEACRYVTECQ